MKKESYLEVIVGPMFAGKTEELIRKARRLTYAKKSVVFFKPVVDDRYSKDEIVTHNKTSIKAINISSSSDILKYIEENNVDVIAIDEVQFLSGDVVNDLNEIANKGYYVICSGLNQDFKGEPFSFIPNLMATADKVNSITAVCLVCGSDATKSQRLINDKPAKYNDPIFLLGEKESYEARCRKHHICKK